MSPVPPAKKANPSEKRILICDDDDGILQMVRATLEAEGFQVRTSRDGTNILKKALDFRPDLIVSDLMMPGGGGYELLRSLQGDDITRKTPVLLMTGYSLDKSTKDMMKQEPNLAGYFEKPIRAERLLAKVHEILNTLSMMEQMAERQKNRPEDMPGGFF